jgi:hypothetical protein
MTDQQQHRATPEQWAVVEELSSGSIASCVFELRDRIENLKTEAEEREATNLSSFCELEARIAALEAGQTCPHIVSSDEGTSYCALAEQTQDKLDRLIELDRALDSKSTPNDRQIRSSAPADSLVERVARAICEAPPPIEGWRSEARAAIREVARWLRSELVSRAVADRLEQEAE